jgi:hypothetical protein
MGAVVRWLVYAVVFVVSAFILHFVVEAAVTLIIGVVSPNTADDTAGLITLILGFALAGLFTWLLARSGLQIARSDEDRRAGEAYLEEEHHRLDVAEQHHLDEVRLGRLMAELSTWRRAHDIRSYAAEALEALGDGDATTAEGTSLRAELEWAVSLADRMDPLRSQQ